MLTLGRYEGQWIRIVHWTGEPMWIRVTKIHPATKNRPASVDLAFKDDPRYYAILREEMAAKREREGQRHEEDKS